MSVFLHKYCPTKLSDTIGKNENITVMREFIEAFTDEEKPMKSPNLLVTGANGVGKSMIIDLCIEEYGYEKCDVDIGDIHVTQTKNNDMGRDVKSLYNILTKYTSIVDRDTDIWKRILVIDNVSAITNPRQKKAIKELIKRNNIKKKIPIIVVAMESHNKFVNDLKKTIAYVVEYIDAGKTKKKRTPYFTSVQFPAEEEVTRMIQHVFRREKKKIDGSADNREDIYDIIIEHSQNDFRRLMNTLEELCSFANEDKITLNMVEKYVATSKTKDVSIGIFEATHKLLNEYISVDDAMRYYSEERATVPLMIHENFTRNIRDQYRSMNMNDKVELVRKITDYISISDIVDGIIYSNQCWNLQQVHGFYSCVLPSYHINSPPNKGCYSESYLYAMDYNKTSTMRINKKAIRMIRCGKKLGYVSVKDLLYMSNLLSQLLDKNDMESFRAIVDHYGLSQNETDSIIKIDKIKKKHNLPSSKNRRTQKKSN